MGKIKKDHSIGEGTGAAAGAVTGAVVGSAAGPAGTLAGAAVGAIAEQVNPTTYSTYFEKRFRDAPYYTAGTEWNDYEPAYRYGYDTFSDYRGHRFDEVAPELERKWNTVKGKSRLAWSDAKEAVRDGWHHLERAIPGDADGDGR